MEDLHLTQQQINEQFLSRLLLFEMIVIMAFGFMREFGTSSLPALTLAAHGRESQDQEVGGLFVDPLSNDLCLQLQSVGDYGDIIFYQLDCPAVSVSPTSEKAHLIGGSPEVDSRKDQSGPSNSESLDSELVRMGDTAMKRMC